MKCPYCHKTIDLGLRKVKAFQLSNEYILVEDFIDVFEGKIKDGTELIYTGCNLGYAKFNIKGTFRRIGISEDEAFIIVMKKWRKGK